MKDKTIRKLRNKFWIFIASSLGLLLAFALVVLYLGYSTFHYQQRQNQLERERVLSQGEMSSRGLREGEAFVRVDLEWEPLEIFSSFELTQQQARELVSQAAFATGHRRFRERFLWQIPFPIVEFEGRSYLFADSGFDHYLGTNLLMFQDLSELQSALRQFRLLLFLVGTGGLLVSVGIAYWMANFLVKPTLQAFERQKRFIADASHELKTPLTIIKSNFSVLVAQPQKTVESQKRWLDNIEFGFTRMTNLTHDLLQLSRIDAAETGAKVEMDLGETAQKLLPAWNVQIEKKRLEISEELASVIIRQNPEKVKQLLTIILDNAIKYSNEGGRIWISLAKNRHLVTLTIKNTGPGIPSEKLPYIFERFYRVEESRNSETGSYGLGLAIAKGLVEEMGGKISAESVVGETTSFRASFRCK